MKVYKTSLILVLLAICTTTTSLKAQSAADVLSKLKPEEAASILTTLKPKTMAKILGKMDATKASEMTQLMSKVEN